MDCPYKTIKVESPSGFFIEMERYSEHHMGAETVELVSSEALCGVNRFRTTNGHAFYEDSMGRMFLYDACLIVEIDPRTLLCRHLDRPEDWYFSEFCFKDGKVCFRYYNGSGGYDKKELACGEIPWLEGLGRASEGRFPSAYP